MIITVNFSFLCGYNKKNLETKFEGNENSIIIYLIDSSRKNNKTKLFLDIRILACQKLNKI